MSPLALVLVIGAAGLHATWNALAKRAQNQLAFLWSAVGLASFIFAPLAVWITVANGFPRAAIPFVGATSLFHALYFYALGRAYQASDYSLVYPVARGLGVALVPGMALALFGERLSPLGIIGVSLVLLGILSLHQTRRVPRSTAAGAASVRAGTSWAVLTGLTIASYSLVDKAGVTRLHPIPYICFMGLGQCALLLPAIVANRRMVRHEWAVNWPAIVVASTMTLTSYLLVLFAFRLSKVGYVVAARELSIVFSAGIGTLWMGEGHLRARLVGAGVILAGVICVSLAR